MVLFVVIRKIMVQLKFYLDTHFNSYNFFLVLDLHACGEVIMHVHILLYLSGNMRANGSNLQPKLHRIKWCLLHVMVGGTIAK